MNTASLRRAFALSAAAAMVTLVLSGCAGLPSRTAYNGGTAADYEKVVEASEKLLDDAQSRLPDGVIEREESLVNDLDEDSHRLSCTDDTSQYVNTINMWLTEGTDEIAIIDDLRTQYEAEGWKRSPSGDEQDGRKQDEASSYIQTLRSAEDFGLSLRRGDDTDGTTILQFAVFSPCIPNPADKPSNWGR
jgi:hypothetical protein